MVSDDDIGSALLIEMARERGRSEKGLKIITIYEFRIPVLM